MRLSIAIERENATTADTLAPLEALARETETLVRVNEHVA